MRQPFLLAIAVTAACTVAHAGSEPTARTFVQGLYDRYGRGETDYLGRDAPAVFAPSLLRLIRRVQLATPKGYAGTPDWDPICGCQDPDGLKVLALTIQPTAEAAASANVRLGFPDRTTVTLKLELTRQGQAWRVSDVEEAGGSLRAILRQVIHYGVR